MDLRCAVIAAFSAFLLNGFASAQPPRPIASGRWAGNSSAGDGSSPPWTLSETKDGEWLAETKTRNPSMRSVVGFDRHFVPTSYLLTASKSDPGAVAEKLRMDCKFEEKQVSCEGEFDGANQHATLAVSRPYTLMFEEYSGDILWWMTSILSQADPQPGTTSKITIVGLADTADDVLELKVVEQDTVKCLRREQIRLKVGEFDAVVFQMDGQLFWVADSGLLLAMTVDADTPDARVELVELQDPEHHLLK